MAACFLGVSSLVLSCVCIFLGKRRFVQNGLSQSIIDIRDESRREFEMLLDKEKERAENRISSIEQRIAAVESRLSTMSTLLDRIEIAPLCENTPDSPKDGSSEGNEELREKSSQLIYEERQLSDHAVPEVDQGVFSVENSSFPPLNENTLHAILPSETELVFIDERPTDSKSDGRSPECLLEEISPLPDENTAPTSEHQNAKQPSLADDPLKHGGRRIGVATEEMEIEIEEERRSIDIECARRGGRWEVFARVPERILSKSPLIQVDHIRVVPLRRGEVPLDRLKGYIVCDWREDGELLTIGKEYGSEGFILFKVLSQGERARITSAFSSGEYLCIAPSELERDESLSGKEFSSPESCSIDGAKVHFFDTTQHKHIAFRSHGGTLLYARTNESLFFLGGDTCEHIKGRCGENVFFKNPPTLNAKEFSSWDVVNSVVIRSDVEHGKLQKLYGEKNRTISIPEGMNKDGGHYSILLYDANNVLIERHSFAFHKKLYRAEVHNYNPFAPANETRKLSLTLHHAVGFSPALVESQNTSGVVIEKAAERTTVHLPGNSDHEKYCWLLHPKHPDEVAFQTFFPYLWWSIGSSLTESVLGDALSEIGLDELRPSPRKYLFVKAPPCVRTINARFCAGELYAQRLGKTDNDLWRVGLDDVGSAIRINPSRFGNHRVPLFLFMTGNDSGETHKFHVADFVYRKKCRFCAERLPDMELKDHLKKKHSSEILKEMFRELSYKELADADETLPREIYKCGYCSFYHSVMHEEFLRSPTNVICEHIKRNHKGATPRFTPVTSISEIREKVRSDIRETWRCNECGEDFTDRDVLLEHAMTHHYDHLAPDGGNIR